MLNNEDLINDLIPNAELSRVVLQSDKNDKLLSNIQFVLRETYTNDNVSSWLEDAQILKYLKIFVIESADKQLTDDLNAYFNVSANRITLQRSDASWIRQLPLVEGKRNKIKIKTIDLNSLINNGQNTNNIAELVKKGLAERTDNSDGSRTYDIFVDMNFTAVGREEQLLAENPEHLSYIFATTYDLRQLFSHLTDTNEAIFDTGKFITETIIDSGEVISLKAQDFREVKRSIQALEVRTEQERFLQSATDFSTLQIEQNLFNNNDNSCISELYSSISKDGDASISFAIDFRKMFIKNSVYGAMLADARNSTANSFINAMYRAATIDMITLKAKRTDLDDTLSNIKQNEVIIKEIHASNLASIEKPLILKNLTPLQSQQIRFFSISDNRRISGTYQYSIEISYRDNIAEFLTSTINELRIEKLKFEEYYKASTMPGVFNVVTGRFRSKNITAHGIFNAFNDFKSQYEGLREINISAKTYIETLTSMYSLNRTKIERYFTEWLTPTTTTPELINSIIKLYDALIEQLTKGVSSTPFINNSLNEKGEGSQTIEKVQSISKTVAISKVFNNTITFDNDYVYEYLEHTLPANAGVISFSSPFSFETLKTDLIFKKIQATSKLARGNSQADRNASVFKDLQNIFYDLSSLYIQKQIGVLPSTSTVQPGQTAVTPSPARYIYELQDPADIMQNTDIQVLNNALLTLLGPTIQLSPQNLHLIIDTAVNVENIIDRIEPDNTTVSLNGSTNGVDVVGLFKDTKFDIRLIVDFPNQIKSLIKMKIETPDAQFGDAQIRFRYEMLKEIKVLNGFVYNDTDKIFSLDLPIWEVLDGTELLLQTTNSDKRYFCSIKDYSNSDIKYNFNKALREKCTNEHFFINASGINDLGEIKDTATDISVATFEERCVKELTVFFSGQTEPDVRFSIDGKPANPRDTYTATKYSYLSPHGVYFDTRYRVIS